MVTSRLDCCDPVCTGLPLRQIPQPHLVQNATARVLTGAPLRALIHPLGLRQPQWFPAEYGAKVKGLVLTLEALYGLGPAYFQDHLFQNVPPRTVHWMPQDQLVAPAPREVCLASARALMHLCRACETEKSCQAYRWGREEWLNPAFPFQHCSAVLGMCDPPCLVSVPFSGIALHPHAWGAQHEGRQRGWMDDANNCYCWDLSVLFYWCLMMGADFRSRLCMYCLQGLKNGLEAQ